MKLIEITPKSMRCGIGPCPAVFETDRGTYVIIGKQLSSDMIKQFLTEKVGDGETAIEFPKGLLKGIIQK